MDLKLDETLKALVETGKRKGYLTYTQVNECLPDDAAEPDKLDKILTLLQELGIDVIEEDEAEERDVKDAPSPDELQDELDLSFIDEEDDGRRIDDPVRMYLTQMGEIPLLKRDQEIALAKQIEIT